ncbi:flagellar basal body P-ring formation chaperone FlgA [Alteromonas sp. ASW11-36]|uniref:Flagella basal body P-ring formation protein FlgA n=1 Tax=Alteromonas arenosi TaxID=3055817 RepID=A0ABT7SXA1_9ALTE|nr:flagellar basal body P-ring formation chaperone FlgA [Alteromonas sp. ASW11-36]MDM7860177.1 flagellar basal body P-ring formation chaperone FlgA [Alteromonas sp. ASW11-36]
MKNFKQLMLLCGLSLASNPFSHAQMPVDNATSLATPHEMLVEQVQQFVTQVVSNSADPLAADPNKRTTVDVFPIDKRVRIPQCPTGYEFSLTDNALTNSYATVKVECDATQWYLFVNAKIEQLQRVVVTAEMLSPDSILTQQNLRFADIKTNSLRHSIFVDINHLVGARVKYRVRPGQPITPNMVCFVCKGDLITLSAETEGLRISTKGIAQQDGNIGDTIQVMNSRSEKIVLAKVRAVDTAVVGI